MEHQHTTHDMQQHTRQYRESTTRKRQQTSGVEDGYETSFHTTRSRGRTRTGGERDRQTEMKPTTKECTARRNRKIRDLRSLSVHQSVITRRKTESRAERYAQPNTEFDSQSVAGTRVLYVRITHGSCSVCWREKRAEVWW